MRQQTPMLMAVCLGLILSVSGCQQEPERSPHQQDGTATPRMEQNQDNHARAPGTGEENRAKRQDQGVGPPKQNGEDHPEHAPRGDAPPVRLTIPPESLEGALIETTKVREQPIKDEIRATATIKPNQYKLTHVSPRIEGIAIEVMAELGDRVRPGMTLAQLDSVELGRLKSELLKAATDVRVSKRNYAREQRLYRQKISSEREYLDARGAYERSLAGYRAAYEALRLVGLSKQEINSTTWSLDKRPLSHFPLKAPHAGTVIKRHITRGELITPKDKPFTIADLRTVWILLDIYEEDLARVQVGSQVRVITVAYPNVVFQGKVVYLSDVLNPDTRTLEARVEIPNPDRRLRPGMFAHATLTVPSDKERRGLLVPQSAVQHIDERPTIFVQIKPSTYEVRHVELGPTVPPFVEVRSGVSKGETVIGKGSFYLKSVLLKEQMVGHSH